MEGAAPPAAPEGALPELIRRVSDSGHRTRDSNSSVRKGCGIDELQEDVPIISKSPFLSQTGMALHFEFDLASKPCAPSVRQGCKTWKTNELTPIAFLTLRLVIASINLGISATT